MITTKQPLVLLQILFTSLPLIRVEPSPSSVPNKPPVVATLLQKLHVLQNSSSVDFDWIWVKPPFVATLLQELHVLQNSSSDDFNRKMLEP